MPPRGIKLPTSVGANPGGAKAKPFTLPTAYWKYKFLYDQVTTVTLTTGARSYHNRLIDQKQAAQEELDVEQLMAEAVEQKLAEVRAACKVLGFEDIRTLGFEDDDILLTREMVETIADLIREVLPDVIITHHPYEGAGFKMHATTAQAVLYAWQQAMGTGRGNARTHYVPGIFFMNPLAYMGHNNLGYASTSCVDLYIDITDVIDKKVEAMDLIDSQHYSGAYSRKCHETSDGRMGQNAQVAYAEAFQSFFPPTLYRLPVTDAALSRQTAPNSEIIARRSEVIAPLMPLAEGQSYTSQFRFPKEMYNL